MRIFVDMDGTLAVWQSAASPEELLQKGYFASLPPQKNVLRAVRRLAKKHTVYILSAYLADSKYALSDKNAWVDRFLPIIPNERRIFVPCGSDKHAFVPGGVHADDILLDDYTHNLLGWAAHSGTGVKLLNGINHTHQTWQGTTVHANSLPFVIMRKVCKACA